MRHILWIIKLIKKCNQKGIMKNKIAEIKSKIRKWGGTLVKWVSQEFSFKNNIKYILDDQKQPIVVTANWKWVKPNIVANRKLKNVQEKKAGIETKKSYLK